MKRYLLVAFLAGAIILAGCQNNVPVGTLPVSGDLMQMQAMIPVIEAGLLVVVPNSTVSGSMFTIKTYTPSEGDPGTPVDTYDGGGGDAEAGETVRFPYQDGSYIKDFYGVAGNEAYLELTPYEGNTDLYRVDLYIYPTLSTTVDYVHEAYLVIADPVAAGSTPWALVDAAGDPAPLNYLVNETVYFDGRIQSTIVEWNRYSDGPGGERYYAIPDVANRVPDDFDDDVYLFPADPDAAEPVRVAAGEGVYSARTVSEIADEGVTVTEYYTDVAGAEGTEIFSASYVDQYREIRLRGKRLTIADKTVRRYYQDVDGNKTVRSRTLSDADYGGIVSSSKVLTEAVDIAKADSGAIVFGSLIEAYDAETEELLYTITTSITETGNGTNNFAGTMVSTIVGRGSTAYEVTLNTALGLVVSAAGDGGTGGTFDGFDRTKFADFTFNLSNGDFTGSFRGGRLQGEYTQLEEQLDVYLSPSLVFGTNGDRIAFR